MTNEQHIENLKKLKSFHNGSYGADIDTAIKALEQESCDDAISRQAVLDKKELVKLEDGQSFYCISPEDVETLPPVTPQPKMGHWIKTIGENGITSAVRCSECGFEDNRYMLFRYCPNCGAKMVEPQETETWNGYHGQITAPKGTFEKIYEDAESEG